MRKKITRNHSFKIIYHHCETFGLNVDSDRNSDSDRKEAPISY